MSGADELDEAIALANSGRARPSAPPAPRLKRIRRIQWSEDQQGPGHGAPGAGRAQGESTEPGGGRTTGRESAPGASAGAGGDRAGARQRDEAVYDVDEPSLHPDPHSGPRPDASSPTTGYRGGTGGSGTRPDEQKPPPERKPPRPKWAEAVALASRVASPLPHATLPLDRALGHTLAAPLRALTDLPSFDTSAMDGWAVSGPGPWELAREPDGSESPGILAGDRSQPPQLADGQAVRIATGARIPPGTSAVLRSEHAEPTGKGRLRTTSPPQPGTDVRPRGQECRTGDELLSPGALITPAALGLSSAAGYDELEVVRRPRAEVLVLGDELLHKGLPHDGLIRDALGPMVGPWLASLGAEVIVTRRLGDDAEALYEAIATTTADVVVTTGGTAAGPVDHLQPTLRRLEAGLLVQGVRVRPGHPMLLAALPDEARLPDEAGKAGRVGTDNSGRKPGRTYLVGLPGNPLAALSGLMTLAAPLLRALAGRPEPAPAQATLGEEVHGHPRDTRLVPVVREGSGIRARIRPLRFAGPAMLRGIASADALAVIPPHGAAPGTDVPVLELPW
ncbi:molybdopterin molybdotransferase MoeA [Streptomyces sp. NBC_01186]|uniref:molybdopterin molybdotransferase MoeA n=1 Tax=Streptomyces sp. NBC_01186 TaxID=2903765 RepID=UPI002E0FDE70|nr:molybdopterin molybdotransferase MoeA [Streptomyces sp. NBC_01186]